MGEKITNNAKELDLSSEEFTEALRQAQVYAKKTKVEARTAEVQERVTTVLADGTEETTNVAEPGDVIVKNPGGEEYVLKGEKFAKRYEATSEDGVFRAKGIVRAIENPTGEEIVITAPWGEIQHGGPEAIIASILDPEDQDEVSMDRYIIGREEFEETYAPIEEVEV